MVFETRERTHRHTYRQTDKHTDRHTYTHTGILRICLILGVSFRLKLSHEDIADIEVPTDVAITTIFLAFYMGCTLVPLG